MHPEAVQTSVARMTMIAQDFQAGLASRQGLSSMRGYHREGNVTTGSIEFSIGEHRSTHDKIRIRNRDDHICATP